MHWSAVTETMKGGRSNSPIFRSSTYRTYPKWVPVSFHNSESASLRGKEWCFIGNKVLLGNHSLPWSFAMCTDPLWDSPSLPSPKQPRQTLLPKAGTQGRVWVGNLKDPPLATPCHGQGTSHFSLYFVLLIFKLFWCLSLSFFVVFCCPGVRKPFAKGWNEVHVT